ncbi:MAG: hypothetical protein QNJ36_13695 [Calothrix sp. MO_167.B42]|nr:hypothetical protein [Calothrix sp. MO_167.B42]
MLPEKYYLDTIAKCTFIAVTFILYERMAGAKMFEKISSNIHGLRLIGVRILGTILILAYANLFIHSILGEIAKRALRSR